jgi:light-regulated signal transduction histidine kinase (bacteriophytochrome)
MAGCALAGALLGLTAGVATHEPKEPLRGIDKYACQLVQKAADPDSENLRKLDGPMGLTLRMNSLLDALRHS